MTKPSEQKTYRVSIPWHAGVFVEVEASSVEMAMEKALEQAYPSVCCQCSRRVALGEMNDEAFDEDCVYEAEDDEQAEQAE